MNRVSKKWLCKEKNHAHSIILNSL